MRTTSASPMLLYADVFLKPRTDIVEGINLMDHNQMAIHTLDGCTTDKSIVQTGQLGSTDCGTGSGCTVRESKANSFGAGFAQAGGGVWATQFDVAGIYMWFWNVSLHDVWWTVSGC